MLDLLQNWLLSLGMNEGVTLYVAGGIAFVIVLVLSAFANFVAKRYIVSALAYVISRSKTKWDDAILRQRVLNRMAHLAPALVIYMLTPTRADGIDPVIVFIRSALLIYMIIILMLVLDSLLTQPRIFTKASRAAKEIPDQGLDPGPENSRVFPGSRLCNFHTSE